MNGIEEQREFGMTASPVLIDLTEICRHLLRTGIQRVTLEALNHWPKHVPLIPFCFTEEFLTSLLDTGIVSWLQEFFHSAPASDREPTTSMQLTRFRTNSPVTPSLIQSCRSIVNLEVFFDPHRLQFYEQLIDTKEGSKLRFLAYDFLPLMEPNWFPTHAVVHTERYFRLLRSIPNLSFISKKSLDDFRFRILRKPDFRGTVIPLGCDSLGLDERKFQPKSRRFSVVGTIEPRKNIPSVLTAFEELWQAHHPVELLLAGRKGWLEDCHVRRIEEMLNRYVQFRWHEAPNDSELRELIRGSRATIFASLGEGFGIPPLESLALGVPVIVTSDIPSIQLIEPYGQVRIHKPDVESIKRAVLQFLDDGFARKKTEEIRLLQLPSWSQTGQSIVDWVLQQPGCSKTTLVA
jgi:glycosyltransferase involved in cell wall biosynthesis